MGFWSWLFGKKVNVEEENSRKEMEVNPEDIKKEGAKKDHIGVKPKYRRVPRTKETKEYVDSIVKKAQSKESEPTPHRDSVDRNAIEKIVDKIQGRK